MYVCVILFFKHTPPHIHMRVYIQTYTAISSTHSTIILEQSSLAMHRPPTWPCDEPSFTSSQAPDVIHTNTHTHTRYHFSLHYKSITHPLLPTSLQSILMDSPQMTRGPGALCYNPSPAHPISNHTQQWTHLPAEPDQGGTGYY